MKIHNSELDDDMPMQPNLRSPLTIRTQSQQIFNLVQDNQSPHFTLHLDRLDAVADRVIAIMQRDYPNGEIPFHSRWRHFEADQVALLFETLEPVEKLRSQLELAIVSVLLDAGAGDRWQYRDRNGKIWRRSEGLAIASFEMFAKGLISGKATDLQKLELTVLSEGLQVRDDNPIVGLDGRWRLLVKLGDSMAVRSCARLSDYFDVLFDRQTFSATALLAIVLEAFADIWVGRLTIDGLNLGDTWRHSALQNSPYVPFHKLSQWLTYSLIEPFQTFGIEITDLDTLTGLAEYRNGGLFLDSGVLELRNESASGILHRPGSELIVEWRALTIVLLDQVAVKIRSKLRVSADTLPLVKILQGGTWTAGREIARELRAAGGPPLWVQSDGTVF